MESGKDGYMKAGVLFAKNDIRYVNWEEPAVGKGQVKVRVKACGICGSDVPRVLGEEAHFYPIILGHEFSGEICEVGEGVENVSEGDHVIGIPLLPCMECEDCRNGHYALCKNYMFVGSKRSGAFADYVVLPQENVLKIDRSIHFDAAALFEPSTVALHGLQCIDFEAGKKVAILGIGAIGIFAVQWARILGAGEIAAFDVDDDRLRLAGEMGADVVINTNKEDTLPDGYDYVIETAGQPETIKSCFRLMKSKGKICCIGTPHRDFEFPWKTWENLNRKEGLVTASWMSYSAPFPGKEWHMTAEHLADGSLKFTENLIHARMPMEQIREAFELYKVPGQVKGRIILTNYAEE